jgi:hypothetical protein
MWSDNFLKLLLMFPLIMAFIAAGRAFAFSAQGTNVSVVDQLVMFVAYFGPYFALPMTFRMGGSLMSSVSGSLQNLSQRGTKRIAATNAKRAQERLVKAQNSQLWNPNRGPTLKLGKRQIKAGALGNKFATWATAPSSNLAYKLRNVPGFSGAGQKVASKIHETRMEQSTNLLKEMNETGMFNDKAYRALSGSFSGFQWKTQKKLVDKGLATFGDVMKDADGNDVIDEKSGEKVREIIGKPPTSMKEIDVMVEVLKESDGATERIGANALDGFKGRLTSLYSDPEMGKASLQAAGIMGLASHGFASGKDLSFVANDIATAEHDTDFAQSVVSRAQVMGQQQRPDIKAGYGVDYTTVIENGQEVKKFISGIDPNAKDGGTRALSLIKTLSSHDLATAKAGAIETIRPTIINVLQQGEQAKIVMQDPTSSAESRTVAQRQIADAQAVKDQVISWAGPYSQASVAVKSEALSIIEAQSGGPRGNYKRTQRRQQRDPVEHKPMFDTEHNPVMENYDVDYYGYAPGTIGYEFDQRVRAETDPTVRGGVDEGGGGPEPDGGGGSH